MIRNSFKNKSEFFILQTFCKNRTSHWSKYIESLCVCGVGGGGVFGWPLLPR